MLQITGDDIDSVGPDDPVMSVESIETSTLEEPIAWDSARWTLRQGLLAQLEATLTRVIPDKTDHSVLMDSLRSINGTTEEARRAVEQIQDEIRKYRVLALENGSIDTLWDNSVEVIQEQLRDTYDLEIVYDESK